MADVESKQIDYEVQCRLTAHGSKDCPSREITDSAIENKPGAWKREKTERTLLVRNTKEQFGTY